uniref:TonB-dependent receptor n=1 Tax=Parapedobacter tibetensis TaxID=2972951 RepID=UPI00214D7DC8
MNRGFYILLSMLVCLPFFLFADEIGRITGKVLDESSNGPLAGVSVQIVGTNEATSTDFEGDFTLGVAPGTYTLRFSSIGYGVKEISEVRIEGGKAVEMNVSLTPSADELAEVVVTVSARKNTEISLLNMQRNAGVVMDGLSSQSIQRTGASTIATAVRTVPGVSVQEGKYVYVRGLGDRYSKTTLNGMDIPGLDPDKNTVQMDIFPTNILENIVVIKSGSAELPADFTGGVVDIVTKDIPAQKQVGVSASIGYNPDMHFNDNYVGYQGSRTDFLGFDNGDRKLPISPTSDIPNRIGEGRESLEGITRSFNPLMRPDRENSMPDLSLGFDFTNQYKLWGNQLGVIAAVNYKNVTSFYEGFQNGTYLRPLQTTASDELRADRTQIGDLGGRNVLLSGMAGLNYKTGSSKYGLNLLHIQNGESRASIYDHKERIANSIDAVKYNLDYGQRSVSNLLLSGKHSNEDATFLTEWKVSPTLVSADDKDVRTTTFVQEGANWTIRSDAGVPTRIWRDLDELDVVGKVDFTKKMNLFTRDASLKFGALYSYKQRDYAINEYEIRSTIDVNHADLNRDPNAILLPENIWTPETDSGYYMSGQYQEASTFDATQHTGALYVSAEFRPWEKLRTIVGLRAEQYTTFFTGASIVPRASYDNVKTIDKLDLFPSLNLVYNVVENQNLRASYARTTARPSFKELSVIQIYDPLTDTRFVGNLDLEPTYIDNIDLRYEFFGDGAQMLAVGGFYKYFRNPIELQVTSDAAQSNFTPRNAPVAKVYGVEVEARKNFGFISESLTDLSLNVNVTFAES